MAILFVKGEEITFDRLRFGVADTRGRYLVAAHAVDRRHRFHRVVVALDLQRAVAFAEQFAGVVGGVAQGFGDKRRALLFADSISDRVFVEHVEHHNHRQTVRVGRYGLALAGRRFLII